MEYNIKDIIKRYDAGENLEFLFFWGHMNKHNYITKSCLSQWFPARFEVDVQINYISAVSVHNVEYTCAEQYMMAEKAKMFNDIDAYQKIMNAETPKEMKALGRQVRNFDASVWNKRAKEIVVQGNIHKFSQNDDLLKFLLSTGDKVLVEASPYDKIWGIGMSERDYGVDNPHYWKGTNWLGFALMEARDELRKTV